ncbi:NGFI-A-binding -like protein [Trichinella papuae]|uniref:NGFI-A-binding-like protein n=1 Tax=Trichinella papuae TaxID=268474 RepID=A0A0V1N243_9BILA|nr:NGFI-A-binding -like protein [Trichinella papuae]
MSNSSTPVTNHLPNSPSEWQLYLVLQRANLLQYYDTFISQGGDDVQQLLEAGEEEFLEIMALVGMASKPLHVRRLQKSLQEYGSNPSTFQLIAMQKSGTILTTPTCTVTQLMQNAAATVSVAFGNTPPTALQGSILASTGIAGQQIATAPCSAESQSVLLNSQSNGSTSMWNPSLSDGVDFAYDSYNYSGASPTLTDGQICRLSDCASLLAKSLPEYEPKMIQNKKKIGRDLLNVMEMAEDAPNRLDEFRKYAAIYGRFDAKRKADKPLTFHEVSVNEAAAQICLHRPALLTRRDELFPLARQVVRDAGYNYMKTNSTHRSESEPELMTMDMNRKRSTPAESLSSSGDKSPASCTSNFSQLSPGGQTENACSELRSVSPYHCSTSEMKKRRRMDEISTELSNILQEQETLKLRVNQAQDLDELHIIQKELQKLTQKQLELTDEQANLAMLFSVDSILMNKTDTVDPEGETLNSQISAASFEETSLTNDIQPDNHRIVLSTSSNDDKINEIARSD